MRLSCALSHTADVTAERLLRFTRTERAAHWLVAATFAAILLSGTQMPHTWDADQPVLDVHVGCAALLVAGLALLLWRADGAALFRTGVQLATTEPDDAAWLLGVPARLRTGAPPPPVGRFNAGQKLNAALTASFAVLFAVSGVLLWLGERDTRFRFASTVLLHDGLMWVSLVLVVGHLYLAVIHPATRHALRGMTLGTVRRDWARQHHAKWRA